MQESSLAPCCLLVNDGLEMGERGEEGGGGRREPRGRVVTVFGYLANEAGTVNKHAI